MTSPPPYAADTRAKGWRFELDYEQIEQSSTWALAGPEARPWLLMLWLSAWRQVGIGHASKWQCGACAKPVFTMSGRRLKRVHGVKTWVCQGCGKVPA